MYIDHNCENMYESLWKTFSGSPRDYVERIQRTGVFKTINCQLDVEAAQLDLA